MDGLTLLAQARAAGLCVRRDGEKLVVRGPRKAEPVVRQLLANKPAIFDALAAQAHLDGLGPVNLPASWWFAWEERASIMEHDGNMPRERAEALALQDVLAQMQQAGAVPVDAS